MSYSLNQDEEALAMINRIAAEPINESQYLGYRTNPKPIVSNMCLFEGTSIDSSKWAKGANGVATSDKKVGKAKTAPSKHVAQVTVNDTTTEKKSDGKIVGVKSSNADTDVKNAPASSKSFDSASKNAVSNVKSKTNANKKFADNASKQRKANEMFRKYAKSLCVDTKSTEAINKILKKFDEISKFAK